MSLPHKRRARIAGPWSSRLNRCRSQPGPWAKGANAPFIVLARVNRDAAVAKAIHFKSRNGGQTCVCANRFYVQGFS